MRTDAIGISFVARFLFLSSFLLSLSPPAFAAEVGTTAGSFAVSPSGAATYSIPITVPPGAGGMQPKLSIEYNSQGGNGLLGMGFSLAGLSAISRCPTTLDQDGFIDGVDFDDNDRFCLDGQRLVATSGAYGAVGTEYRTELESFSKVVSYGGTTGDPAYFRVWTKAGLILEFGATADSRREAVTPPPTPPSTRTVCEYEGPTRYCYEEYVPGYTPPGYGKALSWALNKSSDTAGNYLTVTYSENTSTGESLPQSLQYTGNANAGQTPYASVAFQYEPRPDGSTGYVGGSLITQSQRLSRIQTLSNGALMREYRLAYDQNGPVGRSRLISAAECAGSGTCLPATTFGWQAQGGGWSASQSQYGVHGQGNVGMWFEDINGDGLTDYVTKNNDGSLHWNLSTGTGWGPRQSQGGLHGQGNTGTWFEDINGDGMVDHITKNNDGNIHWNLSTGTGWGPNRSQGGVHGNGGAGVWLVDINGDGLSDYLTKINNGSLHWNLSTGTGWGPSQSQGGLHGQGSAGTWFEDINGDGLVDHITKNHDGNLHWNLATGTGWGPNQSQSGLHGAGDYGIWLADINGDGLADYVTKTYDNNIHWNLSTGSGWGASQSQSGPGVGSAGIWLADVNGDGMVDYVTKHNDGNIHWNLSTGTGWGASQTQGGLHGVGNAGAWFVDFNGDGMADYVTKNSDGGIHWNRSAYTHSLLKSITTGLSATIQVSYKPLTDLVVYAKGIGSAHPIKDVQSPMYVVAAFSSSNGVGGLNRQSYFYEGLRTSLRGRGLLGFSRQTLVNDTTGMREITDYRQDFPFTGMPVKTITRTGSGQIISESEVLYDKITLGSGSAASHFVFAKKTFTRSWDITSYNRVITSQVAENEFGEPPTRETFFGNLTRSVVSTYPGHEGGGAIPFATVTTSIYSNNSGVWHLGRLTRSQVTRSAPDAVAATRNSAFEYDPGTGLLSAEIIEPENLVLRLRTDYARDGFGNIIETTVSGADITSRTTRKEFDLTGRFNTRTINALGHAESRTFDPATGNVLTSTGPNGLVTTYQYDGFGRPIGESFNQHGISTSKSIERLWCAGSGMCQTGEVFYIRSSDSAGAEGYAFFDLLEREVRKAAKSGDGQLVESLTQYNDRGQVLRKSSPRFPGGALYWTTYTYDAIGRVLSESAPAGQGLTRSTSFTYDGLITTQNVAGQITRRQTNTLGKPVAVTDHLNGQILYTYDAFENLLTTRDAGGSTTSMVYDLRGRKTEMTDPNMGRWKYSYNSLGELIRQEDAKGQITTMQYDLLGRMVQRTEVEGMTDWVYDTVWKGALTSVSSPDYIRSYTYTAFGAVESEATSIAAIAPPAAPAPSSTTLQNFQPANGQSGSAGTELRFTLTVPSGAGLKIYTYGGTGDADLYVKLGSAPTMTSYACRSIASDNNDTCNLGNSTGTWHILVRGYSSFAGLSVVGTYAYNGGTTALQKDVPVNNIAGYAATEWRYTFDVPEGATGVRFTTSGGSGNTELYVRYAADASTGEYDCRSDQLGNNAVCDSTTAYNGLTSLSITPYNGVPPPGRYSILLRGHNSFFGAQLQATYTLGAVGQLPTDPSLASTLTYVVRTSETLVPARIDVAPIDAPPVDPAPIGTPYLDPDPIGTEGFDPNIVQPINLPSLREMGISPDYGYCDGSIFELLTPECLIHNILQGWGSLIWDANPPPVAPPFLPVVRSIQYDPPPVNLGTIDVAPIDAPAIDPPPVDRTNPLPPSPAAASPSNSFKEALDPLRSLFGMSSTNSSSTESLSAQSSSASMLDRTLSYTYDGLGRPFEITYPALGANPALKIRHGYSAHGAWETVTNVATGTVYWRAQDWDEWGSAYRTRLGNTVETFLSHDPGSGILTAMMTGPNGSSTVQSLSYQWDARGNLTSRSDTNRSLQETFTYDGLDRLTSNRLYGAPGISGGATTLALTYAANGNITSKTGIGSYTYGAKPQAVTSAGGFSYSYDSNGNMQAAGGRSYTWTSYNLPSRIAEADSATDFLYGPNRQRIRQSNSSSARGGRLSYFFHGLYEEQAYSTYTEQKHHINTPQGVVAIETKGPTNKTEYLHRDHLGSIDAITNHAGTVTQRLSFDAFGKRRGESWELKTSQPDFYTNWGYTGHQQQDDFGLIHMKGRVYNPGLGRFISADPFLQAPENTQSHNRYSYVMNNPLSLIDPTGFSWWGKTVNRLAPRAQANIKGVWKSTWQNATGWNHVEAYKKGGWNGVAGSFNTQGINAVLAYYTANQIQIDLSYTDQGGWGFGVYWNVAGSGVLVGAHHQGDGSAQGYSGQLGYAYQTGSGVSGSVFASYHENGALTAGVGLGYQNNGAVPFSVGNTYSQTYLHGRRVGEQFSQYGNIDVSRTIGKLNTSRPVTGNGRPEYVQFYEGGDFVVGLQGCGGAACEGSWFMKPLEVYAGLRPLGVLHDAGMVGLRWQGPLVQLSIPFFYFPAMALASSHYMQRGGYEAFLQDRP